MENGNSQRMLILLEPQKLKMKNLMIERLIFLGLVCFFH